MTRFDGQRLTNETLGLDYDAIRRGDYADAYFTNSAIILERLRAEGYQFAGESPRLDAGSGAAIGDLTVEAQIFNRRKPFALVAGVDVALHIIRHAAGEFQGTEWVPGWQHLEVLAVQDGDVTEYNDDPMQVQPVLKIRGPYRLFALLETTLLGYLTRATRIATNVYEVLMAANGKRVLFFPARFDLPATQALDGYAYWLAVQRYNHQNDTIVPPLVSTNAQGAWWGGAGGGTIPHAMVAAFLADTAESMRAFARHMPLDVPRIALVDFNNDTVGDTLKTLDVFWPAYRAAYEARDDAEQRRWTLNGVRLDTGSHVRDASLAPHQPTGVNPDLVHTVRRAIDNAWSRWDVPGRLEDVARDFCKAVTIVVSGGFDADRIAQFEAARVPVDSYGVGSTFFRNTGNTDYTMDVVRVSYAGDWVDMAKVGRQPCHHPHLEPVDLGSLG
jgi:nicotinate phosphoribosyltransferase